MSDNLTQAKTLLNRLNDTVLTDKERVCHAIEIAAFIQNAANLSQTRQEEKFLSEVALMVQDKTYKVLAAEITDQVFRTHSYERAANQMQYLLTKIGLPKALYLPHRLGAWIFRHLGKLSALFMPFVKHLIHQKTARVILPGEEEALKRHLKQRQKEGIRLNINHLGEAILGEEEAAHRLSIYLKDLENPDIEYISVKISTLYSQIHLLDWEKTLEVLSKRYKSLLIKASQNYFIRKDKTSIPKFVNLDMEEYRDLNLTVCLFKKVLSDPDCFHLSAGIVLQSYLPDSFMLQVDLTKWGLDRICAGGAPIKIRIVKGANLAMEQVEASIKGWPQAPYHSKEEVDANFKRMVDYAFQKEHVTAVRIGVGSHNLFDIAFALVLASERKVRDFITFEMLEGMSEPSRRALQQITQDLLLYCPVARKQEFQNAVAYLIRRLDENTGPENFLRVAFDLDPKSVVWQKQAEFFAKSVFSREKAVLSPNRTQNRNLVAPHHSSHFENEPDTDFCLETNQIWARKVMQIWEEKFIDPIPLVISGKEILKNLDGKGVDPSRPSFVSYVYQMADKNDVALSIKSAKEATSPGNLEQRGNLLDAICIKLKEGRERLMGALLRDVGKPILESDGEISEAIDFAQYYRHSLYSLNALDGVQFKPKGVVFIASPWNFPCSIAAGGIIAAIAAGNSVIFKPAPEAVLVGYELVQLFYEAGVPKNLIQFVPCKDEVASLFVQSPDVNAVILTGATATALQLYHLRPGIDLMAETGGKNSLIVTRLADRDLAIKDIIQSAFGFSGQKCSACSLAILEAEVFDDPQFKKQLKDAALSLSVGSAYDPATKINPLIKPIDGSLAEALEEDGWLIKPEVNGHLVTPGIRWDVKKNSFIHQNELFGPVLGVMRAENLKDAIGIANATAYGLTSGIHSLDEREHSIWLNSIQAGNCYINRGITGAIVERQPFGGTKKSSFGPGLKAGGPNYLLGLMHVEQAGICQHRSPLPAALQDFLNNIESLPKEVLDSAENYSYYWAQFFSKDHNPIQLRGQSNIQRYRPYEKVILRVGKTDSLLDIIRSFIAATLSGTSLQISVPLIRKNDFFEKIPVEFIFEKDEDFLARLQGERIRLISYPDDLVIKGLSEKGLWQMPKPVVSNGRIELLHYVREISISYDYHRYGNLRASE